MSNQNFSKKIAQARVNMLQAGVSPKYVRRSITELKAHFADLKEKHLQDGMNQSEAEILAGQQLGDLQEIVRQTAARKELLSFISLHPRLTLFVFPLLSYVLMTLLCIGAILVAVELSGMNTLADGEPLPTGILPFFHLVAVYLVYLFPVLLAVALVYLGTQRLFRQKHLLLSLVLISILGSIWNYSITGGVVGEGSINLTVALFGFAPPFGFNADYFLRAVVRILCIFAVAYCFWQKLSASQAETD